MHLTVSARAPKQDIKQQKSPHYDLCPLIFFGVHSETVLK